jgi:PAS domain S-box-containing protein
VSAPEPGTAAERHAPPPVGCQARCYARSAAEYHAMLLDNLYDAVVGMDPEYRVNAWNRAAERLFGWSRDEVMGRPFEQVVPAEEGSDVSTADLLTRDARKTRMKTQARRRTRGGSYIDVESTMVALRDAGGAVLGFVSVNRDISVRKRAQAALRATQRRLQSILEASNDGIWLVDPRGRTEYVNARAAELLQLSVDEMLGRPFVELVPEALRAAAKADFDALLRGERVTRREMRLPRPDGSEACVVFSPSILLNADGSIAGSVSVFVDVTAARRAQEELQQAQKLESVGRLAAGIAHEINTPIQYIGDNTYFLEAAVNDLGALLNRYRGALASGAIEASREELERAAEEIDVDDLLEQAPKTIARTIEGVKRVATIVRAMKEFAHPDRKEMAATDVNRAVLATLEVARNEYKYVADVETDCGDLPAVTCYPGELNQVFLNVVVNAAHAIADVVKGTARRGTIRVVTRREGDEVVISISDTGPGIPEAIRDKIFDPFFTTKDVGRGTGQGLALAQRIVAKHHGHIGFTTAMGQGTTFVIRVPIDPAAAQEARA